MPRSLTSSDRSSLIRLASNMPAGSAEKKAILAGLVQIKKSAGEYNVPGKHILNNARVSGNAEVYGDASVSDKAWAFDDARVYGNARIGGNAVILGGKWDGSEGEILSGKWKAPNVRA